MSGSIVVIFDYGVWSARYPEFTRVTAPLATSYFNEATLYLNNSQSSVVQDVNKRALFLNMIVAHIAMLNVGIGNDGPSPLVGRVASAGEGSVSVGADMPGQSPGAAWYQQTQYGAAYWQATARYRGARYVPGPVTSFNGLGFGYGRSRW